MLTQIESAFHDRQESEEAAVQSEERMRRFVADASHELRTPLTADPRLRRATTGSAAGWPPRMRSPRQPEPGGPEPDLQRVESEAARMGVLVEDLLLLARMDQQRPLERRPVDLLVLAADSVQDARMIAPGRPVRLTVEPGGAFLVLGDEVRLRQVVGNLMTNALTHTPDGTAIDVRLARDSSRGRPPTRVPGPSVPAAVLEVADRGPGLTPDQARRVFERFYRADQARNRKSGGSGLGLAIVSALVAAHGGTATVDSAPGQGATFRITLPLAPGAGRPTSRMPNPAAWRTRKPSRPAADDCRGSPARGCVNRARYVFLRRGGAQAESAARAAATAPSRYAAPNRHACTSSGCNWCSGTRVRQPSGSGATRV